MTLFELKRLFETKRNKLSETDFDKWVDEFWTALSHNSEEVKTK